MAGLIYDSSEMSRIQDLLTKEETQMKLIDKEKETGNKTILRYTILVASGVLLLVLLKIGISRKKK